jgi:putative ABC transport system substrate-binding protein
VGRWTCRCARGNRFTRGAPVHAPSERRDQHALVSRDSRQLPIDALAVARGIAKTNLGTRMKHAIHVLATVAALSLAGATIQPALAQSRIPHVGVLTVDETTEALEPFVRTLREHGWVEGKDVAFEFRHAGGDPRQMAEPAAALVRAKVDVLLPIGPPAVRAAVAATRTIPIVAHDLETDPVLAGYAQSYSRPGGNVTGLFLDSPDLAGKWLELLKTILPAMSRAVVLWDSTSGPIPLSAVRTVAPTFGVKLQVVEIRTPEDIDKAARTFRGSPQALIVLPSPMMYYQSARLAQLAERQRVPATSMFVPFAEAGGLLAYGPDLPASFERCAELVAKILGGAKPGDLPIERPTKFDFVLNLKTAKALRLTMPDTILLRADQTIR